MAKNDRGNFRFMLLCRTASRLNDGTCSNFGQVIDSITLRPKERVELNVVVSYYHIPSMEGKRMSFVVRTIQEYEQSEFPTESGSAEFEISKGEGIALEGQSFSFEMTGTNLLVVQLFDRDGAFGPSGAVLSTYKFQAIVES